MGGYIAMLQHLKRRAFFAVFTLFLVLIAFFACSIQEMPSSIEPATIVESVPEIRQNEAIPMDTPAPSSARLLQPLPKPGEAKLILIHQVQGNVFAPDPDVPTPYPSAGHRVDDSPLLGETVTVEGVVTGWDDRAGQANSGRIFHTDRGIYIQEESEDQDGDPRTSEGVFVQFSTAGDSVEAFPIGSVVRVTGEVVEHFELTVLVPSKIEIVGETSLPFPVIIDENRASRDYYESLEGMRVTLEKGTATSGGTNRHGELFLRPGESRQLSIRGGDNASILAIGDDAGAGNPAIPRRQEISSSTLLLADLFDSAEGVTGVMAYSFDNYKILLQSDIDGSDFPRVTPYDVDSYPYSQIAPASDGRLRLATFNAENLLRVGARHDGAKVDEAEHREKVEGVAIAIELLQRPAIVAMQEVADIDSLREIAEALGGYSAFLEEGNDNRDIDVGFLIADYVNVIGSEQHGENAIDTTGFSCGDINGILFDRPPFVVELEYRGLRFFAVSVHFSSKGAPDECRNAQAEFVADLANSLTSDGSHVIVAGDVNAYEDESALRILEDVARLENLWFRVPEGQAYSTEFSGVLQTLDHILVSEGLADKVEDFRYAHISTHYYDRAAAGLKGREGAPFADGHAQSDHDPAILTLRVDE